MITILNVMYVMDTEPKDLLKGQEFPIFQNSQIYVESSVCSKFDEELKFITMSSTLDGYENLPTVFAKTSNRMSIRCNIFANACSCYEIKAGRMKDELERGGFFV